MSKFIVNTAPVAGLIGILEQLEKLGEIKQLFETQSSRSNCSFGVKSGEKNWLEFPKGTINCEVLSDAVDARISEIATVVRECYKFDLCDTAMLTKHD